MCIQCVREFARHFKLKRGVTMKARPTAMLAVEELEPRDVPNAAGIGSAIIPQECRDSFAHTVRDLHRALADGKVSEAEANMLVDDAKALATCLTPHVPQECQDDLQAVITALSDAAPD